jgi:hypothetical protein
VGGFAEESAVRLAQEGLRLWTLINLFDVYCNYATHTRPLRLARRQTIN